MVSFSKAKPNNTYTDITTTTHNSVMGFLLVFFPEENNTPTTTTTIATKRKTSKSNFFLSSQHSFKRIITSNSNALLSKAQSTLSICFILLLVMLLLFTLSTFEPSTHHHKPRSTPSKHDDVVFPSTALQRMGTLYRRGTRSMNDITVCHVAEETTHDEFRVFLRLLHRSGLTSKSDVVFIFPPSSSTSFARVVREENHSFLSLVTRHIELNLTRPASKPTESSSSFDVTRFLKAPRKGERLWGRKIRTNYSGSEGEGEGGLTRASYGSVLSFDANELDPENSLAGFLERVPLSLRRWACYPMLLGRVRRNFKHVMLVDVKSLIIFKDPLGRVRNQSPDSVFVYPNTKHGRNSERTHLVNSAILMGGARGIRRVSHAMLVAVVRAAMQQHKKKNSVSDSGILSQLVRNAFVLKSFRLIVSSESIPEASSLTGSTSITDCAIVQRGTDNYYDLNYIVKKQICSSIVDSFVYSDCKHFVKSEQ